MLQYSRKITIKHVSHAQLINGTTLRYVFRNFGNHHQVIHTYFVLAHSRARTVLLITITDLVFYNNVFIIQAQQYKGNKRIKIYNMCYRTTESYNVVKEICKISLKYAEKHADLMCFKCCVSTVWRWFFGIETWSNVECRLLSCVWLKCFIVILPKGNCLGFP
jgi:hypothetical protein